MPTPKTELTQARLKELLHYDPETGVFTWRVARHWRTPAGAAAGSPARSGHIKIKIDGQLYPAHRLAFLYMENKVPKTDIDHMDRNPSNNRWANLRPATRGQNIVNSGARSDNTSGFKGVSWHKKSGKWMAYGSRNGAMVHLGLYTILQDAAVKASEWRKARFGDFAA